MDILKPSHIKFYLREKYKLPTLEVKAILKNIGTEFRDRWVESDYQDYSIYQDEKYPFDMVDCYLKFTRASIRKAAQVLPMEVGSVLDYYNGIGLSTIQAMMEWPEAKIYFFNDVKTQEQWMHDYCKRFRIDCSRIKKDNGGVYDAILLFEVLEHYPDPEIFFLDKIHGRINKYLIWSSLFSEIWGGHFPKYNNVDSKRYKSRFKKFLNRLGYIEIFNGFNGRPLIYENIN